MKRIKNLLLHPVTVCILFCSLIISGESNGGFYIFILLLGLPHGALHSLLGIGGIILLIASLYPKRLMFVATLRLISSVCFALSLIRFFTQPGGSYNYPTFHQFVPLAVMIVFSFSLLLFILNQLQLLGIRKNQFLSA